MWPCVSSPRSRGGGLFAVTYLHLSPLGEGQRLESLKREGGGWDQRSQVPDLSPLLPQDGSLSLDARRISLTEIHN